MNKRLRSFKKQRLSLLEVGKDMERKKKRRQTIKKLKKVIYVKLKKKFRTATIVFTASCRPFFALAQTFHFNCNRVGIIVKWGINMEAERELATDHVPNKRYATRLATTICLRSVTYFECAFEATHGLQVCMLLNPIYAAPKNGFYRIDQEHTLSMKRLHLELKRSTSVLWNLVIILLT